MLQKVEGSVDRAGSDLLMIRLNGPPKELQLCSYKKHIKRKLCTSQPGNKQPRDFRSFVGCLSDFWLRKELKVLQCPCVSLLTVSQQTVRSQSVRWPCCI